MNANGNPAPTRWRPGDRGTNVICLLFGGIWLAYAAGTFASYAAQPSDALFPDFFGLWSYGKFVLSYPAANIYRAVDIMSFQRSLAPSLPEGYGYPFPYPPTFLLALAPLGALPYTIARVTFLAATFPLFLLAIGMRSPSRLFMIAAAASPVTAVVICSGQSGFLAAALLVGGISLAPRRPLAAGILLGLLTYKPQLGILVPFALAGAGCWRAAIVASLTAVTLGAITTTCFGWEIWGIWLESLTGFISSVETSSTGLDRIMPTVSGAMRLLGVGAFATVCVQAASSAAMAVWVWYVARKEPDRVAMTVLPAATFLATPYAFVSDMTLIVAVALVIIGDAIRERDSFHLAEIVALAMALSSPVFMLSPTIAGFPCGLLSIIMLLAVSGNRIHRRSAAAGRRHILLDSGIGAM